MLVKVRVTAGAKRESVAETESGALAVAVREPAEGGRANARVIALVRKQFRVYTGDVRIVSGHLKPHKIISITTQTP